MSFINLLICVAFVVTVVGLFGGGGILTEASSPEVRQQLLDGGGGAGPLLVRIVEKVTSTPGNTTATFGNGILPTARQPGEDWPFTTTTSRRSLYIKAPPGEHGNGEAEEQQHLDDERKNMHLEPEKSPKKSATSKHQQEPVHREKTRTISFTAFFDNFEANFHDQADKKREVIQMAPTRLVGEPYVDVSALEGVHLLILFQHGHYLTTLLKPSLVARRKLVVDDHSYDFNITLRLHQWNATERVQLGAEMRLTVTQGRFTANPVVTLRWPIEYRTVVKLRSPYNLIDPWSSSSLLGLDVTAVLSHPSGEQQPLGLNPNDRRQRDFPTAEAPTN